MNNNMIEIDEDEDCELSVDQCEWCERFKNESGTLHNYKNNNYKGRFCSGCIELVDLASRAVEKDNS